jgi:hypothetical protein
MKDNLYEKIHNSNELYKSLGNNSKFLSPNETMSWIPSDSKELFDKNLGYFPNDENLNYYLKNPISYKLNEYGFRTPDSFENEGPGNVFLGCSHTFGIGHHLDNVWSYKLNKKIGGNFWNLSVGGTGIITHFRLLLGFYKSLNIKNIFHLAPIYGRYEFFIDNVPVSMQTSRGDFFEKHFGDSYEIFLSDEQMIFTQETYHRAIKSIAYEIGCKYYYISSNKYDFQNTKDNRVKNFPYLKSRDLIHFNTNIQNEIYNDFLNLYKKENPKNNLI